MNSCQVISPNGRLELSFRMEGGTLYYRVNKNGQEVAALSPLGLVTEEADLSKGLVLTHAEYGSIDREYTLPVYKKARCADRCRTVLLTLEPENTEDRDACHLTVEGRAGIRGGDLRGCSSQTAEGHGGGNL